MTQSHRLHSRHVLRLLRAVFVILPALLILGSLNSAVLGIPAQQPCAGIIEGTVHQDYNANGVRDLLNPNEPGVAGVTVTAYDISGAAIASTATITDGTYVLSVTNGINVRVEFTNFPGGYLSGPFGPDSATSVTFVQSPNCNVDLGINVASQYCQGNPNLVTSCFVFGDQASYTTEEVLVSFPYSAGGTALPAIDNPPHGIEARANQIGTTWGLGYQRASDSVFAAAYLKRHAGLGPLGSQSTGAIYRIANASNPAPGAVSLFLDLNVLFGAGTAGVITRTTPMSYVADPFAWDAVGKIALGDLDVAEDDVTIWAINLNDRQLYEIPIGNPPVAPTAGQIGRFPIPFPADCPSPATNIRPFATAVNNGLVYVGMVCTAETTQVVSDTRAYVYSFNPTTNAFSPAPVLNFPLNYPRRCVDTPPDCNLGDYPAAWRPWRNTFVAIPNSPPVIVDGAWLVAYPQPMLTDIVFDRGDMILGFRDRYADQVGYIARSPDPADTNNYSAIGAGDVLRACASGPGSWTLENNGTCGPITTGGAGNTQGPGNGEYYYQEDHPFHDEVVLGGLFQIAGYTDTVVTAFDPVPSTSELYDGGAIWMDNSNGARIKTYRVFNGGLIRPDLFGKANGLSDIEALCRAAPIEIGNRVWRDRTDVTRDGIQGPTQVISPTDREEPIPGVTVRLYLGGTLIATTTTDAAGEYYFNASNVPGGILPFTTYAIRLDNSADYTTTGALTGLTLTLSNVVGVTDTIDSDGIIVNNYPEITAVTRGYGDNDHTFDFGFHNIPTAVELLYFRVDKVSGKQVHLAWATAVEIDNFGFNLYRAPANDFSRARLIHFEPSAIGGSGPGAIYSYMDSVPSNGVWWYWLADLDTQGHETRHAPVSAAVGLDALLPYRIYLPLITKGPP